MSTLCAFQDEPLSLCSSAEHTAVSKSTVASNKAAAASNAIAALATLIANTAVDRGVPSNNYLLPQPNLSKIPYGKILMAIAATSSLIALILSIVARNDPSFVTLDEPMLMSPAFAKIEAVGLTKMELCLNRTNMGPTIKRGFIANGLEASAAADANGRVLYVIAASSDRRSQADGRSPTHLRRQRQARTNVEPTHKQHYVARKSQASSTTDSERKGMHAAMSLEHRADGRVLSSPAFVAQPNLHSGQASAVPVAMIWHHNHDNCHWDGEEVM